MACEVRQTGLNEIRLGEQDWSQTNNMRWPLVGGAGFQHLARLMRILMFARSILSPNTNQSVIPNEGRMRGFSLFVCRGPSTEENHLDYRCHEIRDPLPFVCTSLYQRLCLCICCQIKSSAMIMCWDKTRSQGDVMFEAVNPV